MLEGYSTTPVSPLYGSSGLLNNCRSETGFPRSGNDQGKRTTIPGGIPGDSPATASRSEEVGKKEAGVREFLTNTGPRTYPVPDRAEGRSRAQKHAKIKHVHNKGDDLRVRGLGSVRSGVR